jgi:hypothetical protein
MENSMKKLTLAALISLIGIAGPCAAQSANQNSTPATGANSATVDQSNSNSTASDAQQNRSNDTQQSGSSGASDNQGASSGASASNGGNASANVPDAIPNNAAQTPAGKLIGPAPSAKALGINPNSYPNSTVPLGGGSAGSSSDSGASGGSSQKANAPQ